MIRRTFGIDFRRSLAQIIAANTDLSLSDLNSNVFLLAEEEDQQAPESRETRSPSGTNATPTSLVPPASVNAPVVRRRTVTGLRPRRRITAPRR